MQCEQNLPPEHTVRPANMTPQQQKRLNLGLAVVVASIVLIIVMVAARGEKGDSFEPMSAVRLQTSDDAGLQASPVDFNGA